MSWLFGIKTQPPPQPMDPMGAESVSGPGGAPGLNQNLTSAERKAMEAYRFDSSALERAAEAAKTLERSSNNILY